MGVIIREEYVCDFCGKGIGEDAVVGRLSLRKAGARGLGRNLNVALHETCSQKLTRYAAPVRSERKRKPA
jgi:hypothetical protein